MSQKIIDQYHVLPPTIKLEIEAVIIICLVIIGMFTFHYIEGWGYLDAAYFTTTTLATVGFGDFVPKTDIGKVLTMCYQLLGIPFFLYAASLMIERRVIGGSKFIQKNQ